MDSNVYENIISFWFESSLRYPDIENGFGRPFNPNDFDEVEEPPPVHIMYPRPTSHSFLPSNDISLTNLVGFQTILLILNICWVGR